MAEVETRVSSREVTEWVAHWTLLTEEAQAAAMEAETRARNQRHRPTGRR